MAHYLGKSTRPSRHTVSERAHPLCKIAIAEARRGNRTYDDLEFASSVLRGTMKLWRRGLCPRLFTIESVLGTVGWELKALPHSTTIPPGLRRELESSLDKFAARVPALAYLHQVPARAE